MRGTNRSTASSRWRRRAGCRWPRPRWASACRSRSRTRASAGGRRSRRPRGPRPPRRLREKGVPMTISVLLTGATGMVGEGVLLECLADPRVARVLVVNRKPLGRAHPKLTEIVHADFHDLSAIERRLAGHDACFFCLGVSSIGMNEHDYRHVTYDLTANFGRTLARPNPPTTFCY